ncbi:MAG: N-methyl-L-tryptophan oxidase [Phycisphaera sp.]|nr:N-methyl-L-tryptophan oxidase [Phycisphaera sp.]
MTTNQTPPAAPASHDSRQATPSNEPLDAIVVGLGAMGACALAELARRGKRVLGVDRFAPPHDLGSSHGGSRVIRLSYFEHPDYVPLLRRAYEGFDRLGKDAGETLRFETGLVMGGPTGNKVAAGMLRSAAAHDLAVDAIDGGQLMKRHPQFRVPADWELVCEARGGFVRPEATIRTALAAARAAGARIELNAPIDAWRADEAGVWIRTIRGAFSAKSLVLSAGAWMPALVGDRIEGLRPTRETIAWIDDAGDPSWQMGQMPVWLFDRGGKPEIYGVPAFPSMGEPRGMKVGLHCRGPEVEPEESQELPDGAIVAETLSATRERVPSAAGRACTHAKNCLYTMSADNHFVVGLHPDHANVAVACGFSGHGFKFAPVIGEALADLAIDRTTKLPIGFLSPTRYGA